VCPRTWRTRRGGTGELLVSNLCALLVGTELTLVDVTAQDYPKARARLEQLKRLGKNAGRSGERISRSKIGKQQEGECSLM